MGDARIMPRVRDDDWNGLRKALNVLSKLAVGPESSPTFGGVNTGYVQFDTTFIPVTEPEGLMWWDEKYHTVNIETGIGATLQAGQELYTMVSNNSGADIADGKVVQITGLFGGYPSVTLAIADSHEDIQGAIRVTTTAIPNGGHGAVTHFGRVNNIDTSGAPFAGSTIWLSADVAGDFTYTRPEFPDYAVLLGAVEVKDADVGVLSIEIKSEITDTLTNFWNGVFRESFDFLVTSTGGVVTGTLTPTNGHPNMTMMFSDGFTTLDTDPGATVTLTPYVGTDNVPVTCYVYVTKAAKVMAASNSGWPPAEHIKVAILVLQSTAGTETEGGALRNQNWNDHLEDTNTFQGHLSHIGERIRVIEAEWNDGAEATLSVQTGAVVLISTTEGHVYQMHKQTFPAQSMPTDNIHVVNAFLEADRYDAYNDLSTALDTAADGTTTQNKWFSIVIWGVCNKTGEVSHLMCNLPNGIYNSEATAQTDSLGYSVYNIPKTFKGTGFLIGRFTIQRSGTTFTYNGGDSYQSLLGFVPNSTAGSGAGGSGISTFLGLTDTPASFTAGTSRVAIENYAGSALEFTKTLTDFTLAENITWTGSSIMDCSDGDKVIDMAPTGAFSFVANSRAWLEFAPAGGSVLFGNATDNPDYSFRGSGLLDIAGDLDVAGDSDIAGHLACGALASVNAGTIMEFKEAVLDSVLRWGSSVVLDYLVPPLDTAPASSICIQTNWRNGVNETSQRPALALFVGLEALMSCKWSGGADVTDATIVRAKFSEGTSYAGTIDALAGFRFLTNNVGISGSGEVKEAYGMVIGNVDFGTANWAIKTGTGKVELGDSLFLAETTEKAFVAGFGQLWCKNNGGTTELWFSDDNGNDTKLV